MMGRTLSSTSLRIALSGQVPPGIPLWRSSVYLGALRGEGFRLWFENMKSTTEDAESHRGDATEEEPDPYSTHG